jgi:hypothetical protein
LTLASGIREQYLPDPDVQRMALRERSLSCLAH